MNTIGIKTFTTLILSLLLFSCSKPKSKLLKTNNKSTYSLNTTTNRSMEADSVKVNFTFNFSDQNTISNPVQIKVGPYLFRTAENDFERKVDKSEMPIQFKITSIGYFSIESKPIVTKEIDSIFIEVNFVEDDRPLIHYQGMNSND